MIRFNEVISGLCANRAALCALALAFSVASVVDHAYAQSSFSQAGENTTADAAAKLLKSPGDTANGSLSNEISGTDGSAALTTSSAAAGKTIEAAPLDEAAAPAPAANNVRVRNCSDKQIRVRSYNPADIVYLVPFKDITVKAKSSGTVSCASDKCKVQVNSRTPTKPMRGDYKFTGTALEAYQGSC